MLTIERYARPPIERLPGESIDAAVRRLFAEQKWWCRRIAQSRSVPRGAYDEERGVGVINFKHDGFDMSGVIAIFKRVVPDIKRIDCYVKGELDVVYRRSETGVWRARLALRHKEEEEEECPEF